MSYFSTMQNLDTNKRDAKEYIGDIINSLRDTDRDCQIKSIQTMRSVEKKIGFKNIDSAKVRELIGLLFALLKKVELSLNDMIAEQVIVLN